MPPCCYIFFSKNIERTYSFVQYLINIVSYRINLYMKINVVILNVVKDPVNLVSKSFFQTLQEIRGLVPIRGGLKQN